MASGYMIAAREATGTGSVPLMIGKNRALGRSKVDACVALERRETRKRIAHVVVRQLTANAVQL